MNIRNASLNDLEQLALIVDIRELFSRAGEEPPVEILQTRIDFVLLIKQMCEMFLNKDQL